MTTATWMLRVFIGFLISLCVTSLYALERYDINELCHVDVSEVSKVKTPSIEHIPAQGWIKTTLPDNWQVSTWKDYNGAAWYKIQWSLQCKENARLAEPIALSIDYINSAGAAYLNNDLLWSDRNLEEPLSKSWNVPRYWILPISSLKPGQNEVLVYVNGYGFQKAGLGKIEFNNLMVNNDKHLGKVWDRRTLFQINMILSGTIGLICFIIWLFKRTETTFAWMAVATLFWILFISNILTTENFPFPSSIWASKVNGIFFIAYIQCFCIYLLRFMNQKYIKTERVFWAILVLFSLVLALSSIEIIAETLALSFIFYILLLIAMIGYVCVQALKKRDGEIIFLAMCLLSILFFVGLDIYRYSKVAAEEFSPLAPYTSPIITIFIVLILGLRLNKNVKRIERFNVFLEEKVEQVSHDLKQSLNEKHSLELDNVRLQERIHLSHELHDSLGASIVRSMILVDQSSQNIPNKHFLSMLKLLRDDLRQIIDSGASANSKVPETPIYWIAPVRYRFTQLLEEMDISVKWNIPCEWQKKPTAMQCLTLIRVIEESLTNVIKHSQASKVEVSMQYISDQHLSISIQDNGVGFDTQSVQQNGLSVGMRSMHLRLEKLGGTLSICSHKGCTLVQATIELIE